MLDTMETADIFLNILYNKSCFLCYKLRSNMTNITEPIEIREPRSTVVLSLSDIVHYLFPSYNITCSQACRNCSDMLIKIYVSMINNQFIRNVVSVLTDNVYRCAKESNNENNLRVNLILFDEDNNVQTNKNKRNANLNKQIDNIIESRSLEECSTNSLLPQIRRGYKRNKKYYNCNDCSYRSLCKGTLEGHKNKHHNKVRPFVCDICYKRFYTKSNLTEHSQTHNKVGEICDVCGDVFGRRRSLVDHLRLHTNDKQYKCDICDKYFVNSGRRLDHMKRNHLEKTECCVFCDKKFGMKKELIRHVKSVHT